MAGWLERYPPSPTTDATYEPAPDRWRVRVWSGKAGQIAEGRVEDLTGRVSEAWTGPQVAWKMARGNTGGFGGKPLNEPAVWIGLCVLFVAGLANWRQPLSLRNLDLLALVSFSVSLAYFNDGRVFLSVPLAYPPLLYLLARGAWIGFTGRREARPLPVWPVWLLAAATVFVGGFRIGLDLAGPGVVDVGYASVVGAHRIVNGEAPYGHMPVRDDLPTCGKPDSNGDVRDRVQSNGRCESAVEHGDTYGPYTYLAYVPGLAAFGWSGTWDELPAARATAIALDLLLLVGLVLVGRRFGGRLLAASLAFAWVAYPFTTFALTSSTNDALLPAALVWGFWAMTSPGARGAAVAVASWSKFAALAVVPLWLTYQRPLRRTVLPFAAGFVGVTLIGFAVLALEPSLWEAVRTFWDRTMGYQLGRESPFSIWGWGQYRAEGIPDLGSVQPVVQVGVLVLAAVAALYPRRKSPLMLAALTAALLLGMQLGLTHWFYLYLPWAFPFVMLALLLPREEPAPGGSGSGLDA